MNELSKGFKGGLWIVFAGFSAELLTLVIQHLGEFQLTDTQRLLTMIFLTAVVARITKYLNK